MRRRKPGKPCCNPCTIWFDDFNQCHGGEVPDPGSDYCEEHIDGFDAGHNWWSDVSGIWQHPAIRTGSDQPWEGWLQAVVPPGLPDHPRLFMTRDIPVDFSAGIDADAPAVGDKWRFVWKTRSGQHLAVEITGPATEGDECCYMELIDITCSSDFVRPDRKIPFYFLGPFSRSMRLTVCIDQPNDRVVFGVHTDSAVIIDERPVGVPFDFYHHRPGILGATLPDSCTHNLRCYGMWLEVDKGAPNTYSWDRFAFGFSRGFASHTLINGDCRCGPTGEPLFSEEFARADESAVFVDSTGHWFSLLSGWSLVDETLKFHTAAISTAGPGSIEAVEHYTHPNESTYILYGWQLPVYIQYRVKAPDGGETHIYAVTGEGTGNNGWRAALKTGSAGKLSIYHGFSLSGAGTGTLIISKDIDDVPFDDWNTLSWCYNGKTLTAGCVLADGREYTLQYTVSINIENTTEVYIVVPSVGSGNAAGDYYFDSFGVWPANRVIPPTEDPDGYGYNVYDACPCCGPHGCQPSPPLAADLTSCFWEEFEEGLVYRGSYSGMGTGCEIDNTALIVLVFDVDDTTGHVKAGIGGDGAMVEFDVGGFAVLTLSSGETVSYTAFTEGSTHSLRVCLGAGTTAAVVDSHAPLASEGGGYAFSTDRPTIEYTGATFSNILISHNIYSPACPDCFGTVTQTCEDTLYILCQDNQMAGAMYCTVDFEIAFDPEDPGNGCCDAYRETLRGGFVLKPNLALPCNFCWFGGSLIHCPDAEFPDNAVITVCVEKVEAGYRLTGVLLFEGTGGGSGFIGTFTGHSDIISPPDVVPDCTQIQASFALTTWTPYGGDPVEGGAGPCGITGVVINVGPS